VLKRREKNWNSLLVHFQGCHDYIKLTMELLMAGVLKKETKILKFIIILNNVMIKSKLISIK